MSDVPARGSAPAPGLLSLLGLWLRSWSSESLEEPVRPKTLRVERDGRMLNARGSVLVLVVDDDPVNRMTISAQLESRGIVPLLAADGEEGVAIACELRFDLILMDLQMPILDGLSATSAIRRFESTWARPAIPVVAYTSASPGKGVLAMHGIDGCLDKPCEDQELEDCLVQWCPAYRATPAMRGARSAHV